MATTTEQAVRWLEHLREKWLQTWSDATRLERLSAVLASLLLHGLLLTALAMIHFTLRTERPAAVVDTTFEDLPIQDDLVQRLDLNLEVSETPNVVPGGAVVSEVSSLQQPTVREEKLATPESVVEPDVPFRFDELPPPSDGVLTQDLGTEEVAGETGVAVEGYGPAMSRLTRELLRLMRKDKLLVAWLFDESYSMKADRETIARLLDKVYEELRIQQQRDEQLRMRDQVLLTVVTSFGIQVHLLLESPTGQLDKIRAAIRGVPVDESGEERMCEAVVRVADKFGRMALRQERRLVLIVVTDESPSDPERLEEAVARTKRFGSPVYILGREAMFGTRTAYIHWTDPEYHEDHRVELSRGPETAFPECLQFDGTGLRERSFPCGFGPYDQMRLARESGGIFFIMPSTNERLVGFEKTPPPHFGPFAMKEYQPQLVSREQYVGLRARSAFRSAVWSVVSRLDPRAEPALKLNTWRFPMNPDAFARQAKTQFARALHILDLLNQSLAVLEKVRPLRDEEPLRRWRANYDLVRAQCLAYRILVFQYGLALDRHAANRPQPQDPKSNVWRVVRSKNLIRPDERQFERIRRFYHVREIRAEYLERLDRELQAAREALQFVIQEHPNTPWAYQAERELRRGYGFELKEAYAAPRRWSEKPKVKIPKF